MAQEEVVVIDAKRTPIGKFQGKFAAVPAPMLAAKLLKNLTDNAAWVNKIDEVILGNVLSAGIGQAPARQAVLKAGLSEYIPAATINKMCGSGLYAVSLAYQAILAKQRHCMLVGGMENMSLAPYLLPRARAGFRLGHQQVLDHMFHDGLEDVYHPGQLMGVFADKTAQEYSFSRSQQDEFASQSLAKAQQALEQGLFAEEIVSIDIEDKKKKVTIDTDECPQGMDKNKISTLKPAFSQDGTVTAANSSSIADGASVLAIMSEELAQQLGVNSIAKIRGITTYAQAPEWFTTAPGHAIKKLLKHLAWDVKDVDLFEINEAFAVVAMAAIHDLNLNEQQVNIRGGACSLGHPIGSSGSRILVTLIHALRQQGLTKGVASLCVGGGEAMAIAIEII